MNDHNPEPDDTRPATPPLPPGTPDEVQPPAEPVRPEPRREWHRQSVVEVPSFDWAAARRAAILAGIIGAIGSLVPLGIFIAFWMLAAGGISITIYRRRLPHSQVSPMNGFRMGAFTGFIGFLVNAGITSLGLFSAAARSELRSSLQNRLSEVVGNTPDPSAQQTLHNLADWIMTPSGLATMITLSLFVAAIFFVMIAGVGGSIGASLFGREHPAQR